jgi:hypothetical protein
MTRGWTRFALCALVAATICDVAAHLRRRRLTDRTSKHDAIATWEDEGGALPMGRHLS